MRLINSRTSTRLFTMTIRCFWIWSGREKIDFYFLKSNSFSVLPSSTYQSVLATLACMTVVCYLFISDLFTVILVSLSIFSICLGEFGLLYYCQFTLDPISMAALIMTIGFSVDLPSHVGYHFHRTGRHLTQTQINDICRIWSGMRTDCWGTLEVNVSQCWLSSYPSRTFDNSLSGYLAVSATIYVSGVCSVYDFLHYFIPSTCSSHSSCCFVSKRQTSKVF